MLFFITSYKIRLTLHKIFPRSLLFNWLLDNSSMKDLERSQVWCGLLSQLLSYSSWFPSEGRACAMVFDCKFIETSASLNHNVQELFEGIVRQIRLRQDSKEQNARRQANCRRHESISKKAKRFISQMVARKNKKMAFKQKSKSCHDLSVL